MGGVIGIRKGHHFSLSDAIEVKVLGIAVSPASAFGRSEPSAVADGLRSSSTCLGEEGFFRASHSLQAGTLALQSASRILNIADNALKPTEFLERSAPIVIIAGTCMNSGKTVAATEIVKQAHHAGLKVTAAKMSVVAALRDTLNMQDRGAFMAASFLDCGLPSTVDHVKLPSVAKAILNHLNSFDPDLIVVELGDGIVGGYSVDSLLKDAVIKNAISSFVFCVGDYVGVVGRITILKSLGIEIDVVAGSVTDSQMGEDFVEENYGIKAGNAQRNGTRLFSLIQTGMDRINRIPNSELYPKYPVHPVNISI